MKNKLYIIKTFIAVIMLISGFIMWIIATMEMEANTRYTWTKPYTSYEAQVIMVKWVGILFLVYGLLDIGLSLFKIAYTNRHSQESSALTARGGATKCLQCGLAITGNVRRCPRCGNSTSNADLYSTGNMTSRFCQYCGQKLVPNGLFCTGCGKKII